MTSSAIIQAAASTRTAPSRQFMVQQATLNAFHHTYGGNDFVPPRAYMKSYLQLMESDPIFSGALMAERVRAEFRKIAAQYQVAE